MSRDKILPHLYHPDLHTVRLLPGTPFYDRQQEMMEFLLAQDTASLLYNFRKAAGLQTGDAAPMTGWDAEDCKLKGHTTGHYLSAVSLAYAATGDSRFADKASEIVDGFAECQSAFAKSGKVKPGFLSAYDEEQFDLLEKFTKYPDIWAPYYTLDKIMAGLLDALEFTGNEQAIYILDKLGCWIYDRLSGVSDEDRARMWSMYIAGEYGGMIGTLVRLYRVTGREEHLRAARLFENDGLFSMMEEGRDGLDGMHANQHIPQIIGAMDLYAATGERKYLEIARNFERIVTEHHCYTIGGTGEEERFRAADAETDFLDEKTAESCASVNMLRLTSKLFEYEEPSAGFACAAGAGASRSIQYRLMDYYERTLFNHILMSQSHCADGGTTYFMPLAPGSCKHYETEESSCCHGTGMESRFRYMSDIFSFERGASGLLRVELPVSSVLDGEEKVEVEFSDSGILKVTALADMSRGLAVRIPDWADGRFSVTDENGAGSHEENGYCLCGSLSEGQSVTFVFPMELRTIEAHSPLDGQDASYLSIAWGPYLLAAISEQKEFLRIKPCDISSGPVIYSVKRSAGKSARDMEEPDHAKVTFSSCGIELKPLYMVDSEHYHIYFIK